MKNIIYLIFFFIISTVNLSAEIAYIDINYLLNNSKIGKLLNNHLKEINKSNLQIFKNIENELIEKEKAILAQQNIINEIEFKKKINTLSIQVKKYREDKRKKSEELNKVKITNSKKILNMLNPIITNYVEKNSISLVLPKKNIIVGKKNLDITEQIMQILNDKHKSLDF